jgi:ribosome-binding factor A
MEARKLDKINTQMQRLVGEILHRHADVPPNVLVTISRVATAPNMRGAEVFLYIYPTEQAETVVESLRGQLYELQGFLNRAIDSHAVPRIRFTVDYGAEHADIINQRLRDLS